MGEGTSEKLIMVVIVLVVMAAWELVAGEDVVEVLSWWRGYG